MENKQSTPISMGNLKISNKNRIFVGILMTLLVVCIGYIIYTSSNSSTGLTSNAPVVKLQEIVIAYAPELKRVIFLDRKTGQVRFTLSDSVTMAVFALKSSEMVTDYSSSLTNKNSPKVK